MYGGSGVAGAGLDEKLCPVLYHQAEIRYEWGEVHPGELDYNS